MAGSTLHSQRHVILIVDACSDAKALVDLAVDLVTEMTADGETQLHGLFIEDEDLLSVADLPCSQEIAQHSARQRNTSREQTLEQLHRQAERFHHYLEQEAQASQLKWSSVSRSGRISSPQSFIESSASCHIFARPSARHVRSGDLITHRIVLLENRSPFMLQALQAVIKQMQAHRVEVMLIGQGESIDNEPSMLSLVRSWQKDFPLLNVREYPRQQLSRLLENPLPCDYVIVSQDEPADIQSAIHAHLGCPVVLVN